ncbi:MAG: hypothetical protein DRH26_01105 [Deltaproteobacteria bacterium]|nr:MAG: hypothetical protein DRH26_01105 [Deltaproteobacteria bacterium]
MRYFVQYSGGVDSVLAVCKLLKTDPTGVYDLFHVQIDNSCPNFWKAQWLAVVKTTKILREKYPKAIFRILRPPFIQFKTVCQMKTDIALYMFYTVMLLRNNGKAYRYIVNGTITPIAENSNRTRGWEESLALLNIYNIETEFYMPLESQNKKGMINSLDSDLLSATWGCWTPILEGDFLISCGLCQKCKELIEVGASLNSLEINNIFNGYDEYNKALNASWHTANLGE